MAKTAVKKGKTATKTPQRESGGKSAVRAPAKGRTTGKGKTALKIVLVVVLVLILIAAALGVTYVVTDGFGGKIPTLLVGIGDELYAKNAEGIALYSDSDVRVVSLTGEEEYTVTVTASAKTNFSFYVGAEQYEWSDVEGKDFTKGFTIEQTEQGFKVSYQSLEQVISSGFSNKVSVDYDDSDFSGDMFEMTVQSGNGKLVFGFGLGLFVTGVEIEPGEIII